MTEHVTAAEFDRMAEAGENIDAYLDWDHATMAEPMTSVPAHGPVIMQVSMTPDKIIAIDRRARRDGRTRDELVNEAVDALLATA